MEKKRLIELQNRALENKATIEDIVEITTESLLSQSNHFKNIKELINKKFQILEELINDLNEKIEKISSPVYLIEENEESEDED